MIQRTFAAGDEQIVELVSNDVLLAKARDALDLIATGQATYIVLHDYNFEPDFFDLSTRKLGEVLQTFANYRICLAVIGDFERYPSKALQALIFESNRHGQFLFVPSIEAAIRIWAGGAHRAG